MSHPAILGDRGVFVDTSGFYDLLVKRDGSHPAAIAIQSDLIAQRRSLVTSNWVLAEAHALILARVGHRFALRVLLAIDRSDTTIVRVDDEDERRARDILVRYDDKDFSLTDATSFAVMERLGISETFSFDRHFVQYGFRLASAS